MTDNTTQHRLLYITTDATVLKDSSEMHNKMKMMASLADELHVIVLVTGGKYEKRKIASNAWAYPTNSFFPLFYASDVKKIVRRELLWHKRLRPELVIGDDIYTSGVIARMTATRYRRRYILQIHSYAATKRSGLLSLFTPSFRTVLAGASRITVASDSAKKRLQKYKVETEKIMTIPPYVDISFIAKKNPSVDVKEMYPQFRFIIVHPGPLTKDTDVDSAAEILALLNGSVAGVGMIVLQGGLHKRRFKRALRRRGVASQAVFAPEASDRISYYKTADLFLETASFNDRGIELVKAFASGTPVVTTDVGLAQHILGDTKYSDFICPTGDVECLTDNVLRVINQTRVRNDFRLNAQSFAFERIIPEKEEYLNQYQTLWHEVISGKEE